MQEIPEEGLIPYPEGEALAQLLVSVIQSFNVPAIQEGNVMNGDSYYSICLGLDESLDRFWVLLKVSGSVSVKLRYRGTWAYRYMREVEVGSFFKDCDEGELLIQARMLELIRETARILSGTLPENTRCIPLVLAIEDQIAVVGALARADAELTFGCLIGTHFMHYEELIAFGPGGVSIVSLEDEDTFGTVRIEVAWEQIDSLTVKEYGLKLVSDDETASWHTLLSRHLPEKELQRLQDICSQQIVARAYGSEQELIEHQQYLYRNNVSIFSPQAFAQRFGSDVLLKFVLSMACGAGRDNAEQGSDDYGVFVNNAMEFYMEIEQWENALQVAALLQDKQQSRADFERVLCYLKLGQLESARIEIDAAIERCEQKYPDRECEVSRERLLKVIVLLRLKKKNQASQIVQNAVAVCPENKYALCSAALLCEESDAVDDFFERAVRAGFGLEQGVKVVNALFNELLLDVAIEPVRSALVNLNDKTVHDDLQSGLINAFGNTKPVFHKLIKLGKQKAPPATKRKRRRFRARSLSLLTQIPEEQWVESMACDEKSILILTNKAQLLRYEVRGEQVHFCWSCGESSLTGSANSLLIDNNILYMSGDDGGLRLLDIECCEEPRLICSIFPVYSKRYKHVAIDGRRMACASDYGIELFDISDTRSPRRCGYIATGLFNSPTGIAYADNFLIVSFMGLRGLASYDISVPTSPLLKDVLRLSRSSDAQTQGLVAENNHIYARFTDGLYCVSVQLEGVLEFESLLPVSYRSSEFIPEMYFEDDLIYCADSGFSRHFSVLDNRQQQIRALSYEYLKAEEESFSVACFAGDSLWAINEEVDRLYCFELAEAVTDEQLLNGLELSLKNRVFQLIADAYVMTVQNVSLALRFDNLTDSHDREELTDIMWDLRDHYAVAWSADAENLIVTVKDLLIWLAEGVQISESIDRCKETTH